jgi:hypothetical protein
MKVPKKVWQRYTDGLAKVSDQAKALIAKYIETHDIDAEGGRDELIQYAYGISTKYGEAAAAYACQMYDAITELEGSTVPPAEPAETATYSETAKAVNGTLKYALAAEMVGTAVGRLVKMAGQDTTLKNAIRDKAYFAWIPSGDTCVYCLMIAAEGCKGRAHRHSLAVMPSISTATATAHTLSGTTRIRATLHTTRANTRTSWTVQRVRPRQTSSTTCADRTTQRIKTKSTSRSA